MARNYPLLPFCPPQNFATTRRGLPQPRRQRVLLTFAQERAVENPNLRLPITRGPGTLLLTFLHRDPVAAVGAFQERLTQVSEYKEAIPSRKMMKFVRGSGIFLLPFGPPRGPAWQSERAGAKAGKCKKDHEPPAAT